VEYLKVSEVPALTAHPELDHIPSQLLSQGCDLQKLSVIFYQLAQELQVFHEHRISILISAGHNNLAVPFHEMPFQYDWTIGCNNTRTWWGGGKDCHKVQS